MRKLTTRQRFALIFTVYVFSFLTVLYALFFTVFTFMSIYQMKKDLFDDMKEIINNHILLDSNQIIFRKDKSGASLRQFLVTEGISAIITDSQSRLIRSYGTFTINDPNQENFNKSIKPLIDQARKTKTLTEKQLVWSDENLETIAVPLINKDKFIGTLVLSRSTTDYFLIRKVMFGILTILGVISIIGSFLVGYFLARKTLNPLIKLARTVENIDLDKLETTIKVDGHPADELVILVDKFNQMMSRLDDMTARQKEFIANASHELKTPLTRMISSLEVMDLSLKPADIQLIKEDLFHINDLLDKLLLLTQLKKKSSTNKAKIIYLDKMLKKIRSRFGRDLKKKEIKLLISSPKTIISPLPVEYLEIILTNFISNSIKYSLSQKKISVSVNSKNNQNKFTIKDEGIGMTEDEVKHMFERFYRGKKISSKEKGHGIGLSIVKQICEIYHINLDVVSIKNQGTIIRFAV